VVRHCLVCLSFILMLLARFSVPSVRLMPRDMWSWPIDSEKPRFFIVDVVGSIKDFRVFSVCLEMCGWGYERY
jgi:hypothetical protein